MVLSCASFSPNLDGGNRRANCRDAFLEKGEQNPLSTLGAGFASPSPLEMQLEAGTSAGGFRHQEISW